MPFGDFVTGQSAKKDAGTTTSSTLAFPANVTAGDILICLVRQGGTAGTVTISDNLNGTWPAADDTRAVTNSGQMKVFHFANSAGGACTITVTFGTSNTMRFVIGEYVGSSSVSIDAATPQFGAANSTSPSSGAATTTHTCLLIGACIGENAANVTGYSAGAAQTLRQAIFGPTDFAGPALQDWNGAQVAGTYTATGTLTTTNENWGMTLMAYYDSSGAVVSRTSYRQSVVKNPRKVIPARVLLDRGILPAPPSPTQYRRITVKNPGKVIPGKVLLAKGILPPPPSPTQYRAQVKTYLVTPKLAKFLKGRSINPPPVSKGGEIANVTKNPGKWIRGLAIILKGILPAPPSPTGYRQQVKTYKVTPRLAKFLKGLSINPPPISRSSTNITKNPGKVIPGKRLLGITPQGVVVVVVLPPATMVVSRNRVKVILPKYLSGRSYPPPPVSYTRFNITKNPGKWIAGKFVRGVQFPPALLGYHANVTKNPVKVVKGKYISGVSISPPPPSPTSYRYKISVNPLHFVPGGLTRNLGFTPKTVVVQVSGLYIEIRIG